MRKSDTELSGAAIRFIVWKTRKTAAMELQN